jgi:hypothetical protein
MTGVKSTVYKPNKKAAYVYAELQHLPAIARRLRFAECEGFAWERYEGSDCAAASGQA